MCKAILKRLTFLFVITSVLAACGGGSDGFPFGDDDAYEVSPQTMPQMVGREQWPVSSLLSAHSALPTAHSLPTRLDSNVTTCRKQVT